MVQNLKAIYENVKTCIKFRNKYTNFFTSYIGLKQGDPLLAMKGYGLWLWHSLDFSLTFFCLRIHKRFSGICQFRKWSRGILSQWYQFIHVFYADDFVLFAKSPDALQQMLNKLYTYSQIWDLSVNTKKKQLK